VIKGAKRVLRSDAGEATAEEIAQNLAAGVSPEGKATEDVYGVVGKHKAREIRSGQLGPRGILNALYGYAKQRAIDAWRKYESQQKQRELVAPSLVHEEEAGGLGGIDTLLTNSPTEVLQSLLSGPIANQFKSWLRNTVGGKLNPTQRAVLEAILEVGDQKISNEDLGQSHWIIEVRGEPISGQMVGKHRDAIEKTITREIKRNPKVLDWIDNYFDLSELGYGGGQHRIAKIVKRVAVRYLLRRRGWGRNVRQPGGLMMDRPTGMHFSMQTSPQDPYGQMYDAAILLDTPVRPYKAALAVISQNWTVISHMKTLWEVESFVNEEVRKSTGKTPRWHDYSMPD
jgi:hypothetical protein